MPLQSETPTLNFGHGEFFSSFTNKAIWGSGEYRSLSNDMGDSEYAGNLFGFNLGVDAVLPIASGKMLGGIALSISDGDFNYLTELDRGEYDLALTSLNPYLGYDFGVVQSWLSLGFGSGDIEITAEGGETNTSDLSTQNISAGGSTKVWENSVLDLNAKGQISSNSLELDGDDQGNIAKDEFKSHQVRVGLEMSVPAVRPDGAKVASTLEVGLRHDGGDGDTGAGVALSGGVSHNNSQGLILEGNVHALLGRDSYREWGISGLFRLVPGRDGQGLSLRLSPGIGQEENEVDTLLKAETWSALRDSVSGSGSGSASAKYVPHLKAELGVGLASRSGMGMFTPYSAMNLTNSRDRYQLGIRWQPTNAFNLDLSGENHQSDNTGSYNEYLLKGEFQF